MVPCGAEDVTQEEADGLRRYFSNTHIIFEGPVEVTMEEATRGYVEGKEMMGGDVVEGISAEMTRGDEIESGNQGMDFGCYFELVYYKVL